MIGRIVAAGMALAVAVAAPLVTRAAEPSACGGRPATIMGTAGNDALVGTPGADVIVGLGGNDGIAGLGGDDVLCGGSGADDAQGGAGADLIDGGPDRDDLRGGSGVDTVSYRRAPSGVTVDLEDGIGPDGDSLKDIENAIGSPYADTIIGTHGGNRLVGLADAVGRRGPPPGAAGLRSRRHAVD